MENSHRLGLVVTLRGERDGIDKVSEVGILQRRIFES